MVFGQAARGAFTRGKEHWSQLVNGSDQSRMHDHAVERHNGAMPEVRMDVTGSYGNDCMLRQISEAVQIRATKSEHLLNKKTEWNQNVIPHLNLSNSP